MLKRVAFRGGSVLLVFALLGGGVWWYIGSLKRQPALENDVERHVLSQQEVIALTKPAVVRIIQRARGTAVIPNFDLDLQARKIQELPGESRIPFDQYYSGSGFIVRPDGYIVTNSHVVSRQTVQLETISKTIMTAFAIKVQDILKNPEKYQWAKDADLGNQEQFEKFGEDIAEYLLSKSTFQFDEKKVVVLDPSMPDSASLSEFLQRGFPAKMVSVNDSFFRDDKDTALIKIEQENLPTLKIGDQAAVGTGNRVYVFGFPATADTGVKNFLESTFTSGTVSALKDAEKGTFKIIQTDAKVSHGSSGGPLLNEKGEVVGIITQQSADRNNGDAFAFAIPADIISQSLTLSKIPGMDFPEKLNDTQRLESILEGMALADARHCSRATERFQASDGANTVFGSTDLIATWIEKCRGFTQNGESLDTRWDEMRREIGQTSTGTWWLIGGGVFLLIMGIAALGLLAVRSRKEHHEIETLKMALAHQEGMGAQDFDPKASSSLAPKAKQPRSSVPSILSKPVVSELSMSGQSNPHQSVARKLNELPRRAESPVSTPPRSSVPRVPSPFAASVKEQAVSTPDLSHPASSEKTAKNITFLK